MCLFNIHLFQISFMATLPYSHTLKIKAACSAKMLVTFYQATWHLSPYFIYFAKCSCIEGLLQHKFCVRCIST
jgi:hypothetical protein